MTPEQEAAEEQLAAQRREALARFEREMLQAIRRDFFGHRTEKQFYQERNGLLQAITYPAWWLNKRGVYAPASKYRAILQTVLEGIRGHTRPAKVLRFSAYFLKCVQEHMAHQGERYYDEAKSARGALDQLIGGVLKGVRHGGDDARETTKVLVEVNWMTRSKGGRKKKAVRTPAEADWFA